jgi:hypothetical protein
LFRPQNQGRFRSSHCHRHPILHWRCLYSEQYYYHLFMGQYTSSEENNWS